MYSAALPWARTAMKPDGRRPGDRDPATAHISERTAENHVQHILTKLGFATRAQIAAWVARTASGRRR